MPQGTVDVAILEGTNDAEAATAVPFKIEYRIDHVLQHTRPGNHTLFGHVTDQKDRGSRGFGDHL